MDCLEKFLIIEVLSSSIVLIRSWDDSGRAQEKMGQDTGFQGVISYLL